MNKNAYALAEASFAKAEKAIPLGRYFAPQDLFRIYTQTGMALHEQGLALWKEKNVSPATLAFYEKAKASLTNATRIDDRDYLSAYWLARTENALEVLSPSIFPSAPQTYNAQPLYEKATRLRPSGITVHHSYIRYLYAKGDTQKLSKLAQYMTQIYPSSYYDLKKEPFFNDTLLASMEKGLLAAIDANTDPRLALQALSDIQVTKQNPAKAVALYLQSLDIRPFSNTSASYLHMGRLYLKTLEFDKSIIWFAKGLETADNFDNTLGQIFSIHNQEKALAEFLKFCRHVEENLAHPPSLDILVAKAWMEMENPGLARSRLLLLNAKNPKAQAYYLLARIAEQEKDWDQVEVSAQKATTLDRENAAYYHLFARALLHQKKYAHAEEMAAKALKYAPKENPWYFNHRAWTRWHQKKYPQALTDWKRAFSIKSDYAEFPYCIALAYEREGFFKEGLSFVQQALALTPDNPKYKELKKRLNTHK
ncbi:MAG: hypothetical protein KKF12_08205 [Proteobacteria bacterium]|nr:hypothetical protein [Pseudomonadota bacterium]MBU4130788.1 hypothetical protein [Pseudomonadota bacterium]